MSALILPKVGCTCLSQQTSYLDFVWRVHELSNNIWIMLENEPHLNEIFRIIIKLHRSLTLDKIEHYKEKKIQTNRYKKWIIKLCYKVWLKR